MTKSASYGVPTYDALHAKSGLDFMRAIRDGELPQAPIAKTLGFLMTEVREGEVVFTATPSAEYYNPLGGVHGGWYGTLLDSCMGCAVHTKLPQGIGYTTVEYSVNLVRAITVDTGLVRAEGRVVHGGRRMATAEGRIVDEHGKLYAHGTTTCMVMDLAKPKS